MKKQFNLMAVAASALLALTACTTDKLEASADQVNNPTSADNAVQFGTYMGRTSTTRTGTGGATGDMTLTTLKTTGFGVIAYAKDGGAKGCYSSSTWNTSSPNFMYNTKVTNIPSSDNWTYSPIKYWPNDFAAGNVDNKEGEDEGHNAEGSDNAGKVSFFAYAPYVDLANATDYSSLSASTTYTEHTAFDTYILGGTPAQTDKGIVAITANNYTEQPEIKYILSNTDPSSAVDLLWGTRASDTDYTKADNTSDAGSAEKNYNIDLTKQNVGGQVKFNFKHALAKIGGHIKETSDGAGDQKTGLQVVLDIDNINTGAPSTAIKGGTKTLETLVTIEEIKIRDLKTYSDETGGSLTSDLMTEGWFNIANGTWDNVKTAGATYSSNIDKDDVIGSGNTKELNADIKEPSSAPSWSSTLWTYTGASSDPGVTTTPKDVYAAGADVPGCLLIPDPDHAQNLVVTIKYNVRTYDTKLAIPTGESSPCTKISQTITNQVTIPAGSLESNKYYKLLMHLGLTSVKFTAVVDDWDEATNGGSGGNDNNSNANDKDIFLPSNTLPKP